MTQKEILRFCRRTGPQLQKALAIEDFRVTYEIMPSDACTSDDGYDVGARVLVSPEYHLATIFLSATVPSETVLYDYLRHELMHVVLSPYQIFGDSLAATLPVEAAPAARILFNRMGELTVGTLERTTLARRKPKK